MSTVLTKPVLLDETGQAIVGKLQDIQQAIGGTGEFIPINIRVTTPPTKTTYLAGETLDLSGMVVTLVASNGGMYDITGDCVFSPADGATVTSSTTEVNISYTWYKDSTVFTAKQPIDLKELASIDVTTPPTKTSYYVGDTFDPTGMVVTATFDDSSVLDVSSDVTYSPSTLTPLTIADTIETISYTIGGVTKTTTQSIEVSIPVYGVTWDGTASPVFTRTGAAADFVDPIPFYSGMSETPSSPFDNIMPWSGMVRVEDPDLGTLVAIPKFYYKLDIDDSTGEYDLKIANQAVDGFLCSPAHSDRNDGAGERDVVYIGAYYSNKSNYKSEAGKNVRSLNLTRTQMRSGVQGLGSNVYLQDYALYMTLCFLFLVEFAHWDYEIKVGKGLSSGQSGATDSFNYHTGTTSNDRTVGGNLKYRNIDEFLDVQPVFLEGIHCKSDGIYFTKKPSDFADPSNWTRVVPSSDSLGTGAIKRLKKYNVPGFEFVQYPSLINGSASEAQYRQYVCARCTGQSPSYPNFILREMTSYIDGLMYGEWSGENISTGMRLMKLPQNI